MFNKVVLSGLLGLALSRPVIAQATVGDVRYSILPPAKFESLNPGWVLMDGNAGPKSRLAAEMNDSLYRVPDARGVFLRGMNEGRNFNQGGDPDARGVGTFQGDGFGSHNHAGLYAPQGAEWASVSSAGPSALLNILQTVPQQSGKQGFVTGYTGIVETRPRNITVYTYIKIN